MFLTDKRYDVNDLYSFKYYRTWHSYKITITLAENLDLWIIFIIESILEKFKYSHLNSLQES